jgi:hypothetical protein
VDPSESDACQNPVRKCRSGSPGVLNTQEHPKQCVDSLVVDVITNLLPQGGSNVAVLSKDLIVRLKFKFTTKQNYTISWVLKNPFSKAQSDGKSASKNSTNSTKNNASTSTNASSKSNASSPDKKSSGNSKEDPLKSGGSDGGVSGSKGSGKDQNQGSVNADTLDYFTMMMHDVR